MGEFPGELDEPSAPDGLMWWVDLGLIGVPPLARVEHGELDTDLCAVLKGLIPKGYVLVVKMEWWVISQTFWVFTDDLSLLLCQTNDTAKAGLGDLWPPTNFSSA